MLKLRQSIVFAIVAFNITGFTVLLQLNQLIINSPIAKVVAWLLTIAAWRLTYLKRKKYFTIF
jgi:hypothetical protein